MLLVDTSERTVSRRTAPSRHVVVGALVTVCTAVAYLVGSTRSLDYDSSVTVAFFVRAPGLLDPFRYQHVFNNHPTLSAISQLVWRAGGTSEPWLRLLPALCGAGTAGLVAAWSSRRWGVVAGVGAGCAVAVNPMFAELSRNVRGYSLVTLCCTAATFLLVESVSGAGGPAGRARSGRWYVGLLAVALSTHLYAALVVLGHAGYLASTGGVTGAWVRRWVAAIGLGSLAYAAMSGQMLESSRWRGHAFHAWFPAETAWEITGGSLVPVLAIG